MSILFPKSHSRRVACATGAAGQIEPDMFMQLFIKSGFYLPHGDLTVQLIRLGVLMSLIQIFGCTDGARDRSERCAA